MPWLPYSPHPRAPRPAAYRGGVRFRVLRAIEVAGASVCLFLAGVAASHHAVVTAIAGAGFGVLVMAAVVLQTRQAAQ